MNNKRKMKNEKKKKGLKSVVQFLPTRLEGLGPIHNTTHKNKSRREICPAHTQEAEAGGS
jgi:hypothetical protein